MKRRGFVSAAALVLTGGVISRAGIEAVADESLDPPDDFTVCGWRVAWSGWREPANQNAVLGTWFAVHPDHESGWASCTMGSTRPYRELEVIDMTYLREHGALITCFSTEAERAMAKRDALKRLLVSLKTGHSFGRVSR